MRLIIGLLVSFLLIGIASANHFLMGQVIYIPPLTAYLSAVNLESPNLNSGLNTTIPNGGSATLTWDSNGAASCTSADFTVTGGSAGIGSVTVSPTTTKTYSVSCGGSPPASVTVTVSGTRIDAAAGVGTGSCTGAGTSASPWNYHCIQNAANTAVAGDTVFLRAGNWRLNTAPTDAAQVVIDKQINLVGAGSGNTFDTWGHVSNPSGAAMCPTGASPTITCVYTAGTSYLYASPPTGGNEAGGILFGNMTSFTLSTNCVNVNISHMVFDGSAATNGGDYEGLLVVRACSGPVNITDIRHLTFGDAGGINNPEMMLFTGLSNGVTVTNSLFTEPQSGIGAVAPGQYTGNQVWEPLYGNSVGSNFVSQNNAFYQYTINPTLNYNLTYTGNQQYMYNDGVGAPAQDSFTGPSGDLLGGPIANFCTNSPTSNGICTGSFNLFHTNNLFYSPGLPTSVGGGVNDSTTNGGVNNLTVTGNWIIADNPNVDSCVWFPFVDQSNCSGGNQMMFNALVDTNCVVSNNGTPFTISNNSLIGVSVSEINVSGVGMVPCAIGATRPFPPTNYVTTKIYGVNAHNNYIKSASNKYTTNANTISPVQTNNFCTPAAGTVTGCATSGFTTAPTVSFTLGKLHGTTIDFASTNYTAQYGAVQWLASTSPTTPLSSDSRWSSNNSFYTSTNPMTLPPSAANSYTPPVSLSGIMHGSTVYMWVMDSAGNIGAATPQAVP